MIRPRPLRSSAVAGTPLGASYLGRGRTQFLVWAPRARAVEAHLVEPRDGLVRLSPTDDGFFAGVAEDVAPGTRYFYRLDGSLERPDPASRYQPRGVHGPSEVVDHAFDWNDDAWRGLSLEKFVLYELHVGTFTEQGTFEAAIEHLDALRDLGVTAVEIMPVGQFPGTRNWGYDGAYPFAAQHSYGGPLGLKALVDACHARGLAAVLDVVYNHLGPEGNYLSDFGPYFTDRYRTPWGPAINFDGPQSDFVRRYFIENALQWVVEFHFDALRLDALHAIIDTSARPFVEDLAHAVHDQAERQGRGIHLIAESDRNDPRFILPPERGGFGLDAQWLDDFHHSLHALLTGERSGYYQDFGGVQRIARSLTDAYVYAGQHSRYRERRHGRAPRGAAARNFVVCAQNHDQIGNRPLGERLSTLVPFEALKLAAAAVALSPFIPMLFMGEEYAETNPFLYFVDHSDRALAQAVREGRRAECAATVEPPDPFSEETFRRSVLVHARKREPRGRAMLEFHRALLALRRDLPVLAVPSWDSLMVAPSESDRTLLLVRRRGTSACLAAFNFGPAPALLRLRGLAGSWRKRLDSADLRWMGPGPAAPDALDLDAAASIALRPWNAALFAREG